MNSKEFFFGGRVEDPDEIQYRLSETQRAMRERLPVSAEIVREAINVAQNYKLGNYGRTMNIYQQQIDGHEEMRVWAAKKGVDLFSKVMQIIPVEEDKAVLERAVELLTEALERDK